MKFYFFIPWLINLAKTHICDKPAEATGMVEKEVPTTEINPVPK